MLFKKKYGILYFALIINGTFNVSQASPWLEANDVFFRSSAVLLSDAKLLSAPVNHYPARWSHFGEDLAAKVPLSVLSNSSIVFAKQELGYTLQSALLNRGNKSLKVVGASAQPVPMGFGQFQEDKMGLYTSYEYLDNEYAFRVSANYRDYNQQLEMTLENSYFSFNKGAWLYSIGNIDRWWGQGWQHNLILGSYAKAAPDMSVSYTGKNALLGIWNVETVFAFPDNANYDYHSATRVISKPFTQFEYGITYQTWFSGFDMNKSDKQLAIDGKLTLPHIDYIYHNVYAEAASTANLSELGAWLIGWTGSFPFGQNTGRIVLESQQSTNRHDVTRWQLGVYPSTTRGVFNTTYPFERSRSVAFYFQLKNDHNIGISYKKAQLNNRSEDSAQLMYRLPILAGMINASIDYRQTQANVNSSGKLDISAGYEFRF